MKQNKATQTNTSLSKLSLPNQLQNLDFSIKCNYTKHNPNPHPPPQLTEILQLTGPGWTGRSWCCRHGPSSSSPRSVPVGRRSSWEWPAAGSVGRSRSAARSWAPGTAPPETALGTPCCWRGSRGWPSSPGPSPAGTEARRCWSSTWSEAWGWGSPGNKPTTKWWSRSFSSEGILEMNLPRANDLLLEVHTAVWVVKTHDQSISWGSDYFPLPAMSSNTIQTDIFFIVLLQVPTTDGETKTNAQLICSLKVRLFSCYLLHNPHNWLGLNKLALNSAAGCHIVSLYLPGEVHCLNRVQEQTNSLFTTTLSKVHTTDWTLKTNHLFYGLKVTVLLFTHHEKQW